jgi:hypothetical protein
MNLMLNQEQTSVGVLGSKRTCSHHLTVTGSCMW